MKAVSQRTSPEFANIVVTLTGPLGPEARFSEQVAERRVEFDALVELLQRDTTAEIGRDEATRIARAVAAGCLGDQHLWRDLGLPDRATLRMLLEMYFGQLAADNTMDMRWKKYIYRGLCRWGGFATCKSPSCGLCEDYSTCFGSE